MPPKGVDVGALCLLAVAAIVYGGVNHYRLAHFYPLDYDLSIFAQGLFKLSRLETPFVTVRGMNLFGEHASFVHVLLAPLEALLGRAFAPHLLPLVQTVALAFSGLLLFRSAHAELGTGAARLVLCAYLLYPALQYTWLEYYEPVNLAVPCLIAAHTAIRAGRDRPALAWSLLALLTMENVALTVAALGAFAFARRRFRLAAVLVLGSGLYVLLLLRLLFPWLEPGGYAYAGRLFGDYASDLPAALLHLARPRQLLERLATPENGRYLLGLLTPVAFLPVAAPATLLLAVQLPVNMVSSWPYAHEIRYHYVAPVVPFVFLAVVRVLARTAGGVRRLAVSALVAATLAGQVLFASPWLFPRPGERWWRGRAADARERVDVRALLALVPPHASVSAHYRFLPHLARRERLYMFPDLGPTGVPDLLLIDLDSAYLKQDERRALLRARGRCSEIARTPRAAALLSCGVVRPDLERPLLSPPVARPPGPSAP